MMANFYHSMVGFGPMGGLASFSPFIILILIWSIIWKGLALWKAARLASKVWFAVLLVVNTLGILEILYLYVFTKKSKLVKEGK